MAVYRTIVLMHRHAWPWASSATSPGR